KKYDIRGQAAEGGPLTPEVARLVGLAFGTWLQERVGQREVVVGRDNRHSSPALAQAVMEGLAASGCRALDLGLVSTPFVYWWAVKRQDAGGLMVTGSHLPPDQNGFKLSVGARNLYGDELQTLRANIERDWLRQGAGEIVAQADAFTPY